MWPHATKVVKLYSCVGGGFPEALNTLLARLARARNLVRHVNA